MKSALLYPYGVAQGGGILKSTVNDFKVVENLGFSPLGQGEHLFVLVEKAGLTTFELIEVLARDFGIKPRDIGYSGLKDRQAVTRQWLSLHLPGQMHRFKLPEVEDYAILEHGWHQRKLKRGSHRSNSFEVILRDFAGFSEIMLEQIESIKSTGMANYFGQQRFGSHADNLSRAIQVFANPRKTRKLSRNKRGLYISALRSHLFNQVLSNRIEAEIWRQPIAGDVFMLEGTQSIFCEALSEEIVARYQNFDISSTASLFGLGANRLDGRAREIEDKVYADHAEITDCLLGLKASLQMRALRVAVKDLELEHNQQDNTLQIRATLPRGSYFTTLLNHFVDSF
ncbi:MAG: tRNA pseudouridine(13) synthase TruD [Gammaproteobacteria bacterium]|nr:tRNA pseudouridine(13) synthase TruD [Gammaproteobacteria bacterium]